MIDRTLNYGRHHIDSFTKGLPDNAVALDLGAGLGYDLLIARKNNPNIQLHAVESFPPYQQHLREKGITVHEGNMEKDRLPFKDASIDLVICNQVLEHCKEIWWIMNEITRVLKVGGRLVIGIPNLASLHNRILLLLGKQPTAIQNNSAHVRGYTKKDICRFIIEVSENGYVLNDFGGSNFYPFPAFIAKPLAVVLPKMAWGNFYSFEKTKPNSDKFIKYPVEKKLETNFYLGV